MDKNEVILSLRSQLTGELTKDLIFLEEKAREYSKEENGAEIAAAIAELALELMPQKHLDFMHKTIYIGERRLDQVYAEAAKLMKMHEYDKAVVLTGQIYDKIREQFGETEEKRFFSFHNLLESNLYYVMYHPTKRLEKTPFDFVRFLTAHAFNLIELRRPQEAVAVLEEAIRYNPVSPDPRFELAEAYKMLCDNDKLLAVIRDTLPICATPYALSRSYTNLGYYCVEKKEYEKAVCFYFESLIYANHPAVPAELRHVSELMGKKIEPPTRQQVLDAFASLEIPNGPNQNVIGVAAALGEQAMERKEWENATFYLRVVAEMTNHPEAHEKLNQCRKELEKKNA